MVVCARAPPVAKRLTMLLFTIAAHCAGNTGNARSLAIAAFAE